MIVPIPLKNNLINSHVKEFFEECPHFSAQNKNGWWNLNNNLQNMKNWIEFRETVMEKD